MYLSGNLSPQASSREPNQGLVFFIIMINDLVVENPRLWIYVHDTTISETVAKGELSNAQRTTDQVVLWSLENRVQLNTDKGLVKKYRGGWAGVFGNVVDKKHMTHPLPLAQK